MLDEEDIKSINESKWLSIMLGVIIALIAVVLISFGVWGLLMSAQSRQLTVDTPYSIYEQETEIQWNTEHMEKF